MISLCALSGEWDGSIPDGGLMCEEKHDGIRGLAFRGIDGVFRLFSRNGYVIEGVGHILHQLSLMERAAGVQMMFDGEFIVEGTLAATKAWFERGHKFGGEAGVLKLFDGMPYPDWRNGGCDEPLYRRKARLSDLAQTVASDDSLSWEWRAGSRGRDEGRAAVEIIPDAWVMSAGDALDEVKRIWSRSGEGCVLKVADAPYRRARSNAWMKLKPGGPWWRKLGAGATGGKSGKD